MPPAAGTPTIPDLTLPAVAGLAGVSATTAWRWAKVGVEVGGGRIKLRAVRVGGCWRTRREWLDEYLAATTEASGVERAPVRTPAVTRRAGEAAGKRLERMGL